MLEYLESMELRRMELRHHEDFMNARSCQLGYTDIYVGKEFSILSAPYANICGAELLKRPKRPGPHSSSGRSREIHDARVLLDDRAQRAVGAFEARVFGEHAVGKGARLAQQCGVREEIDEAQIGQAALEGA